MADVSIYNEIVLLEPPDESRRRWETRMSPILAQGGYKPSGSTSETVTYVRSYRPGWTIAVAILLFPIGLIALMTKNESSLFATFEAYGSGTMVKLTGVVPPKSKEWLDGFTARLNEKATAEMTESSATA